MDKQWIKVRRGLLEAHLTCGLCGNMLKDATGNTQCSHTFCRECVYSVIEEEEIDCCPVCETDWGISPVQKMRPDHNLQSLRDKVFPSDSSVQSAAKGKEKSPSPSFSPTPLAIIYPRGNEKSPSPSSSPSPLAVIYPSVATGQWESNNVSIEEPVENEEKYLLEYHQDGSYTVKMSSENSEQTGDTIRLFSLSSSDATLPLNISEDSQSKHEGAKSYGAESKERLDTTKPLSPSARRSKSLKSNAKGKAKLLERVINESDSEVQKDQSKGKKGKKKVKDNIGGESSRLTQEVQNEIATNAKLLRNVSIWFSLTASKDQEGVPLPQVDSHYIRIKDGSMTISIVQKYLKEKLGLLSEDEIEIKCMGKSVHPIMEVQDLLQSWMALMSKGGKVTVKLGSSGKEFVMPLTYGRKL